MFKFEVTESPETLATLLQQEKAVRRRERLPFLYWYKTGQAKTRQALGKLLNRSQLAIGQWIDRYRRRGLIGLLHLKYHGGNLAPSIPVEIQYHLKEKLAQPEGVPSDKAIQVWLNETQGVEVPYSTVFGTVRYRRKADLKLPRPYAVDPDPEAVEEFKKNGARQPD